MDESTMKVISDYREDFHKTYDIEKSRRIWKEQSERFQKFWQSRIMTDDDGLTEDEMIPIVQILDVVGKRRNEEERKVEGVAFTNITQPTWYDVFRGLKSDRKVKTQVDALLKSHSDAEQIDLLNQILESNVNINALTGGNGTILNAFIFAYRPEGSISSVTLSDRYKIVDFFELENLQRIQELSWGERMIVTRQKILSLNDKLSLKTDGRGVCKFLYSDPIRRLWKQKIVAPMGYERRADVQVLQGLERRNHAIGPLINFRDMDFGPTEENGVIFLFSKITGDLGLKIVSIQKPFPDAEAIKYGSDGRGYKAYIEFEFLSSDFQRHKHLEHMRKGKPCDMIVCWEHDWKECPKNIEVLELRKIIKQLAQESV